MKKPGHWLVIAGLILFGSANAETNNCQEITTIPYYIANSGVYCLRRDFMLPSGYKKAITVGASNVTLDMNGFRITNTPANIYLADGITASGKGNLVIRNGILSGFSRGLYIRLGDVPGASRGHIIENMRVDNGSLVGMEINGSRSIVRNNVITNIVRTPSSGSANGIFFSGSGSYIEGNMISNVYGSFGLYLHNSSSTTVKDNYISHIKKYNVSDVNAGMYLNLSNNLIVRDNYISSGADIGIFFNNSSGIYKDNMIANYATKVIGGTDQGGN